MMRKRKPEEDEQDLRDLKQSTDVFWHLVENANQAIVISQGERVKYFNPQTLEWTGYTEKELMTRPFVEFIHPEDRDLVMKEYQERISGVKKSSRYNLRVLTKTGDVKWAIVHSVLFEWEGKPASLTTITNITEQKETEAALSESEAHLRAFIENTEDMICGRDREGGLLFWNTAFNASCERLFGVKAHVGLRTGELVSPEQLPGLQRIRENLLKVFEGERVCEEYAYQWSNGETHFYETTWAPILLGEMIIGASEVTRVITEQKRRERRLWKSKERFRAFMKNSSEAIWCIEFEKPIPIGLQEDEQIELLYKHGYIAEANDAWARMLGYESGKELLEMRLADIMPIFLDESLPTLKEWVRTRYCFSGIESVMFSRDGQKRVFLNNLYGIIEDGHLLRIWIVHRDITERKHAENALNTKGRLLEESQRIAHLGSWDWNIVTNELEWSEEVYRIFGLSSQEFGATYDAFLMSVHPDDREEVKTAVNHALSDPSWEYNIVHRITRPDGSEALVRERGKVSVAEDDRPSRMIGTVQDITDIKMMEAETQKLKTELSHVDRLGMMGVLSASIAHEINQPLAAILSNAQAALRFLTNDPQDLDEVKEALQDVIYDDKRAGEIVRNVRSMMRGSELDYEQIDLNEAVSEVLTLLASEALSRTISLSEDLQPDIPPVYGNRISIQQVILNLVVNALEAIKSHPTKSPEILVSTRSEGNEGVILSVSDTGPGVQPDHLASIFDSFHTTKTGGLGMGLSICKTIAREHEGKIWAENRSQGGSTFFFRLPSRED